MNTDFTWLIGGPQGSGVESGANIFSKVCSQMGYQVFGKREFYSNIKGEHSYFTVRISDEKIHSNVNDVNLMVSFDAETIFRHFDEISSDIYADKPQFAYVCNVIDRKDNQIKLFDLKATIYRQIVDFARDGEYGNPADETSGYDITIVKEKTEPV